MAKVQTFDIIPDRSLFGKLGARSRAFPMVVTELVDNSLDSWMSMPSSKRKPLKVEIQAEGKNAKNPYFIIKDNAGGMTAPELAKALTVAHSDKTDDPKFIGEYGFGLKAACMYIGHEFEIFSLSHKEPGVVHTLLFNRQEFEKVKDQIWKIPVRSLSLAEAAKAEVYFPKGHGTEIRIKNEKYVSANKSGIEKRLSRIFGPRLPKKSGAPKLGSLLPKFDEMSINFNGDEIFASGPFYTPYEAPDKANQDSDPTEKFRGKQDEPTLSPAHLKSLVKIPSKTVGGRKASGVAGIIDRGMGHNNKYGFDLIKNGRVIEMNVLDSEREEQVGLSALNHNARIAGQLYLDDNEWKTDHQKTEFLRDYLPESWTQLSEFVAEKIKSLRKISADLQEPQRTGNKPKSKEEQIVENTFKEATEEINSSIQAGMRKGNLKKILTRMDNRTQAPPTPTKPSPKGPKVSNTGLIYSKPIVQHEYLGRSAPLFRTQAKKSGSTVLVTVKVNFDHPFISKWESGERKAIAGFICADAMAEYIFSQKGLYSHADFVEIRESILASMAK